MCNVLCESDLVGSWLGMYYTKSAEVLRQLDKKRSCLQLTFMIPPIVDLELLVSES